MEFEMRARINIDRPIYEQEQLQKDFSYEKPRKKRALFESGFKHFKLSQILYDKMPILRWLPHYKWRRDFVTDFISGITIAIIHIPQGIAYSLLANLPPIVGIYMAFFPVLIYSILGTSRHNSMGTFAVISLMTGKVILEHSNPIYFTKHPLLNDTIITDDGGKNYTPIEVATVVAFCTALIQLLMYVFRLGTICTMLLSDTLVSAFTVGAGFQVLVSLMKDIFGLNIPNYSGLFGVVKTCIGIFQHIQETNSIALIIALVTFVVNVFNNECIKPRLAKKCLFPIPIELLIVVTGTLASQYWDLENAHNIQIAGYIPSGLPSPAVPPLDLLKDVAVDTISIATVSYMLSLAMALTFSQKFSYEVDANQELLAHGLGNMFGSFFSCMPFTTAMGRSLIQLSVGGKTQLTSLVSCAFIVFILLWVGPLFSSLPKSVLAAVIIVALKPVLMQITDVTHFWATRKMDALLWLTTFLVVLLIRLDIGLLIGLTLSFITVVYCGFQPYTCLLGSIPNTDIYLDISAYKLAAEVAGLKIFHFRGGLNFASRYIYKTELWRLTAIHPHTELIIRKKLKKIMGNEDFQGSTVSIQNINSKIEKLRGKMTSNVKFVILDFSAVTYIDPSGITVLKLIAEDFRRIDIHVAIAECSVTIYEVMKKCGFLEDKDFIKMYPTVHDAVQSTVVLMKTDDINIYF